MKHSIFPRFKKYIFPLIPCLLLLGIYLLLRSKNSPCNGGRFPRSLLDDGQKWRQDDPCLIEFVREKMLDAPSTLPYNVVGTYTNVRSENTIAIWEKRRLIKKYIINPSENPTSRGFFIECGANDGEFLSNTLKLEQDFGWTGLLVEANPSLYEELRTKHRKAWSISAAACLTPFAEKITLFVHPSREGHWKGVDSFMNSTDKTPTDVQCIPLYTMLAALNVTEVDFLSLDAEGAELGILGTIPFDKVRFKVLTVEYPYIPVERPAAKLQALLGSKGYVFVKKLLDGFTRDLLFVHNSLASTFRNEFGAPLGALE